MKEIYIYDEIGPGWAGLFDAKALTSEMPKSGDVTVHINSPGGDYFEGLAMFNILRSYRGGEVTAEIDSIAASAATLPAMAADSLAIAGNGTLMIHNPYAFTVGDYRDKEKDAEVLRKARDTLARTYAQKTGLEVEKINDMLDAETWMSAEEAIAMGFADSISNPLSIAACMPDRVAARYKHVPEQILERAEEKVQPIRSAKVAAARIALARM